MFGVFLDRDVPRFTWRTVLLWGALSPFAAVGLFFVARAEGAAAWVQAVGSVVAIFTAIGIAEAGRRDQQRQKETDAEQVDLAHEKRLWCLLWECNYLATQLNDQLKADQSIMPGKETKDLLVRLLDRAVRNFDDDLDVWRLDTASDCRYMLSVYIHACERRIQKLDCEEVFVNLTSEFQAGLNTRLTQSSARFNARESGSR